MNLMRTISDDEKVAILERRHALIVRWLQLKVEEFKKQLKVQPSPMDFQMSTSEEERAIRDEIECHNSVIWVQLGTYQDILKAIEKQDVALLAEIYPQLDFSI